MSPPIITLTTDFGTRDGYVGAMKGVILSICPEAHLVDITHELAPGNIQAGALTLRTSCPWFPPYAVHVAVVDPGVGTSRKPVVIQTQGGTFVGPDNGLFSLILQSFPEFQAFHLDRPHCFLPEVSATFHGRDVFASAAAHLASGTSPGDMGSLLENPVRFPLPRIETEPGKISGRVLHVDHFGNLVTNIPRQSLPLHIPPELLRVRCEDRLLHGIRRTYGDVRPGAPLALIGSSDFVEISVNQGRASDFAEAGSSVEIIWD